LSGSLFLRDLAGIPESLPGEPVHRAVGAAETVVRALFLFLVLLPVAFLSAPAWIVYAGVVAWRGRPPNVPRWAQVRRIGLAILSEHPPSPGLPPARRLYLLAQLLRSVLLVRG
jgi:hypothetical protein